MTPKELSATYARMDDDKLRRLAETTDSLLPEAIPVLRAECRKRGIQLEAGARPREVRREDSILSSLESSAGEIAEARYADADKIYHAPTGTRNVFAYFFIGFGLLLLVLTLLIALPEGCYLIAALLLILGFFMRSSKPGPPQLVLYPDRLLHLEPVETRSQARAASYRRMTTTRFLTLPTRHLRNITPAGNAIFGGRLVAEMIDESKVNIGFDFGGKDPEAVAAELRTYYGLPK